VSPKYRALLCIVLLVVACVLAPFVTGHSVRLWLWWIARQEKLTVKTAGIDAPFLGPVTLHGLQVSSSANSAYRIDLSAKEVVLRLNFKRLFLRTRDRALRNISASDLRVEIRRNETGQALPASAWSTWQKMLPDSANFQRSSVRVENGPTVVILRGANFSAAEIESGRFSIDEFTIASPLVRRTFSHLRGATQWQDDRLTFAGVSLTRGLDLDFVSVDLAHLSKQRVSMGVELDAFGGKLRGNISDEWRPSRSTWTIAASASDISLSQTGEAVGLADRVAGRIRAAKFTYQGEPSDPAHATASLWSEITAPAWRNREADIVMLGAAFYNRQIDIQQLYIKQHKNQLTLNGQAPWPERWSDWLNADYRANISATINDVADFASLFGGQRDKFGGVLSIDGTIDSHARKIGGQVAAEGRSMKLFGSPVNEFELKLNIVSGVADIADFHLQRNEDFIRVQGKIDLLGEQGLRGTVELGMQDLAQYFPTRLPATPLTGRLDFYGRSATFDGAEFGDGANSVPLSGTIDFKDIRKIDVSIRPLWNCAVANSAEIPGTCVNRLELVAPPSDRSLPRVDRLELRGDVFTGLDALEVQTDAGEQKYRIGCAETDAPLQMAVAPRPQ
jgi:hypothetical protein